MASLIKRVFFALSVVIFLFAAPERSFAAAYDEQELDSLADERYESAKEKVSDIYDSAIQGAKKSETVNELMSGKPGRVVFRIFYSFYYAVRKTAIFIGAFSMLLGFFLCWLVKHNKYLMRKFFLTFVVGVPLGLVVFCFGVGILIG